VSVVQEIGSGVVSVNSNGEHVELFCTFTSGGTAINVLSPQFSMATTGGTDVTVPDANLLVPFTKHGEETGLFHITFLASSSWLDDGTYNITMSGNYPSATGDTVQITGTFQIRSAPTAQYYIDLVRQSVSDRIPALYQIDDPEKYKWEDGQLYDAITRSLNFINHTPPSDYTWSIGNMPWPGLLVDGAVFYALHQRGLLEVANTLNYNDEISFAIDRSQKYLTMAQALYTQWLQMVGRVKRNYAYSRAGAIGMGQTRLPYTIIRSFSFHPNMQSVLSGVSGVIA